MHDLTDFYPQRILVCQQRQIGDALLVTPALELLKHRFPQAQLHLFTEKKCEPLLRHNPHIDALHLLHKREQPNIISQLRWYRSVAAHNFDLVVDFQQLPRCAMLTFFSHAAVRLSHPAPWYRHFLYTHEVAPAPGYAAAAKASQLGPLGIAWRGEKPLLFLTAQEHAEAASLLTSLGLRPEHELITIDATHRRASKRWPAPYFARLIELLGRAQPHLRFLLLRGPGEEEEVTALAELCAQHCTGISALLLLPPLPSLRISAACMARASLHIGNCSAPRHIAVALNVPSLIIPGASGPEWTYPDPARHRELRLPLPCYPCSRIECSEAICLTKISPDFAAATALDMLGLARA